MIMHIFTPGNKNRAGFWHKIWMLVILSLFSFLLVVLYQGMRSIMLLGGFVARGGPYQIAHPAPDWIWVLPVSTILIIASMLAAVIFTSLFTEYYLMVLSWPALFLGLGWNFLTFGLGIDLSGRPVWGWLVCAVVFILMGLLPLIALLKHLINDVTKRLHSLDQFKGLYFLLLQILVVVMSVLAGTHFFRMVTEIVISGIPTG